MYVTTCVSKWHECMEKTALSLLGDMIDYGFHEMCSNLLRTNHWSFAGHSQLQWAEAESWEYLYCHFNHENQPTTVSPCVFLNFMWLCINIMNMCFNITNMCFNITNMRFNIMNMFLRNSSTWCCPRGCDFIHL